MQQRRYRPGDVLDDYCPRERRITDHAIVAMIDDNIKQTRCVVCDAEHEYKDGKVPVQRRKKSQAALFTQVLDGLQGPQPAARLSPHADPDPDADPDTLNADDPDTLPVVVAKPVHVSDAPEDAVFADPVVVGASPTRTAHERPQIEVPSQEDEHVNGDGPVARDDRPWRRQLIRAALPRPEGHVPQPTRQMPEFTVRQPTNNRGHRHGHRSAGPQTNGNGPMRFGRDSRDGGQGHGGQHPHNGRRRRRGKKQSS